MKLISIVLAVLGAAAFVPTYLSAFGWRNPNITVDRLFMGCLSGAILIGVSIIVRTDAQGKG